MKMFTESTLKLNRPGGRYIERTIIIKYVILTAIHMLLNVELCSHASVHDQCKQSYSATDLISMRSTELNTMGYITL